VWCLLSAPGDRRVRPSDGSEGSLREWASGARLLTRSAFLSSWVGSMAWNLRCTCIPRRRGSGFPPYLHAWIEIGFSHVVQGLWQAVHDQMVSGSVFRPLSRAKFELTFQVTSTVRCPTGRTGERETCQGGNQTSCRLICAVPPGRRRGCGDQPELVQEVRATGARVRG